MDIFISNVKFIDKKDLGGCGGVGEGGKKALLPKICYTYPAMMKLGTVIP